MVSDRDSQYRAHFVLQNNAVSEKFSSRSGGGGGAETPDRNRSSHGASLLGRLQQLEPQFSAAKEQQQKAGLDEGMQLGGLQFSH